METLLKQVKILKMVLDPMIISFNGTEESYSNLSDKLLWAEDSMIRNFITSMHIIRRWYDGLNY